MPSTPSISTFAKLGLFAIAFPFAAGCNGAEGQPSAASPADSPSIVVVGRGETHAKPDIAYINLGVEERGNTVSEAMQQNAALMSRLMTTLGRAGIADKDIQTSSFNVRLERELHAPVPFVPPSPDAAAEAASSGPAASKPAKPAPAPKVGQTNPPHPTPHAPPAPATATAASPAKVPGSYYMVSNNVRISVHDVSKVGTIIDAAASAGANNIWGVSFDLEKKDSVEGELREKAVADARRRAEALAKLENINLGPVLAVSELVSGQDNPPPMPYAAARESAAGTPVEPGQITVQDQIKVVFAIKR